MLFSITKRNVTRATLHRFYVSLAGNNYTLATNQHRSKDSVLQCITLKHNAVPHRHMMYKNNKTIEFLPLLPDHMYKRTTLFQNLSLFFSVGYLRAKLDPDFSLNDVLTCMRQVVQKVSSELVQKNYESLTGLVDENTLKSLQERIDSLSFAERNVLELKESEIIACIPIYIKIENAAESQPPSSPTRVDFNTMIYYRPACAASANDAMPVVLAANYLFVRDYVPNQDTDWTIKYINYARKCIYSGY